MSAAVAPPILPTVLDQQIGDALLNNIVTPKPAPSSPGAANDELIAAKLKAAQEAEENAKDIFTKIFSGIVGALATAATEGLIDKDKTDAVLGFIYGQTGLAPKDEHTIVMEKLDKLEKRLVDLKEGQKKLADFIAEQALIDPVIKANDVITHIWESIKEALENNDEYKLRESLHSIGITVKDVLGLLKSMHNAITDSTFSSKGSLGSLIQARLKSALQNANGDWSVTPIYYTDMISFYNNAFVDIERSGTALLLIYEQSRVWLGEVIGKPNFKKIEGDILKNSHNRIAKITAQLKGDALFTSAGMKLLYGVAASNFALVYPVMFVLRLDNGKCIGTNWYTAPAFAPPNPSYLKLVEKDCPQPPTNQYVWGFVPQSDGTWSIRGSSNEEVPDLDHCYLMESSEGPCFPYGTASPTRASFKLIPEVSGADGKPRFKIVQRKQWDAGTTLYTVSVERTDLPRYTSLDDAPDQEGRAWTAVRYQKYHSTCTIENNSPYILVLEDVASPAQTWFSHRIWIPGCSNRVSCGGPNGVTAIFKFMVYKLKDPAASPRAIVDTYFRTLASGKPGIHPDVADPQHTLFFRVKVTIGWIEGSNKVNAIEMNLDDPNARMVNVDEPQGLLQGLDMFEVTSKNTGERSWNSVKANISIDGGDGTKSRMTVYNK